MELIFQTKSQVRLVSLSDLIRVIIGLDPIISEHTALDCGESPLQIRNYVIDVLGTD